jgi:hypothetical protein
MDKIVQISSYKPKEKSIDLQKRLDLIPKVSITPITISPVNIEKVFQFF